MSILIIVLVISILCLVILFVRNKLPVRESFFMGSLPSMPSDNSIPSDTTEPTAPAAPSFSLDEYIGPTYNYAKKIKTPKKLKVTDKPTLFALPDDFKAVKHYVETLAKGNPPLGDRFFVKSGKCSKDGSVPECQEEDRWIFVNNVSTGRVPCTDYKSKYKGLIPGMIEDIMYVNPYEIFKAISGTGKGYSTDCYLRTEKVGTKKKNKKITKCSVPTPPPECMPSF